MSDSDTERTGPPLPIRVVGRAMTETVTRVPGLWRVMRGPATRYFDGRAADWEDRVQASGDQHLAPLKGAVEELGLHPTRILDVGTGTGAGARWLAQRFEAAEVLGVDISPEMIEQAEGRPAERVRYKLADTRAAAGDGPFDLVVHLNCPVLFADVAAALAEGGTVLVVASSGRRTPFYTSHGVLRRGFTRAGLEFVAEGRAGAGTWLAAKRPS